ncbi:MAG TPA: hypothetical protein VGP85_08025 [Pyrinomonadaceae bacterium]|jgi:hypothetical protein|nr:hypothetical protein [Pyrinomonadaceae bacterium]
MQVTHKHLALLVFLWIGSATLSVAQKKDQFLIQQKKVLAQNPAGVSFAIQTTNNQTRFRQGEVISLQLSFSSSQPKKYHLDAATYDRSGRLQIDDFHVDPTNGVSDPLDDYFNFQLLSMAGGLRSYPTLEVKPYVVKADLNEWRRFDRPGKYRLYVTSHRVGTGYDGEGENQFFVVTSNVIELEIVPADPSWSRQTLAAANAILDGKNNNSENRRDACRVLRFLGSNEAVQELVRRFDGTDSDSGCTFEFDFGLRGTSHRALALNEMESQLTAPDFAVTMEFLNVLTFLSFIQQNVPPMPPSGLNVSDEASKLWRAAYKRSNDIYDEILNNYRQRLLAAVFNKNKHARAVSLETLLLMTEGARDSKNGGEDQATLKHALAPIFSELPAETQQSLLEYRWRDIAGDEMLPVLRRLYEKETKYPDLTSLALSRLYELSPDEGRRLIIEEMRKRDPRVNINTLTLLPDETLPEVDALVEERAGTDNFDPEVLLQLAERYASSAVAAKLKSSYEKQVGRFACAPQEALLSYFLRVDPDTGLDLVERALASRKATGCYETLLGNIARKQMSPELEKIAISSLDDADSEMVRSAAEMLGRYGSKDSRDALLHRFEQWRELWDGREKELTEQRRTDPSNVQMRLEETLFRALANSPAWLADEEMITKLRQLCVSRNCTSEADSTLNQFGPNITVFFDMRTSKVAHTSIGQYNVLSLDQLKTKVTQYPKGTTFMFGSDRANTAIEQNVFDELKVYLEKYEMKLKRFDAEEKPQ